MRGISAFFLRVSRGKIALATTVLFMLFMLIVLPRQAALAERQTQGAGSPDTTLWYTPEDLFQFAETYGEAGRAAYVRTRWTFDLIYPLVYASFLISTISWTLAYTLPPGSAWLQLNLIPFAGWIFDYLENLSTSIVMLRYPKAATVLAIAAPVFSFVKWIFVLGSFLVLTVGLVMTIRKRLTYR